MRIRRDSKGQAAVSGCHSSNKMRWLSVYPIQVSKFPLHPLDRSKQQIKYGIVVRKVHLQTINSRAAHFNRDFLRITLNERYEGHGRCMTGIQRHSQGETVQQKERTGMNFSMTPSSTSTLLQLSGPSMITDLAADGANKHVAQNKDGVTLATHPIARTTMFAAEHGTRICVRTTMFAAEHGPESLRAHHNVCS